MRSGGIYLNNGYMRLSGIGNVYWSAMSEGTTRVYYLSSDAAIIYPTNRIYRYNGLSARCLASGVMYVMFE